MQTTWLEKGHSNARRQHYTIQSKAPAFKHAGTVLQKNFNLHPPFPQQAQLQQTRVEIVHCSGSRRILVRIARHGGVIEKVCSANNLFMFLSHSQHPFPSASDSEHIIHQFLECCCHFLVCTCLHRIPTSYIAPKVVLLIVRELAQAGNWLLEARTGCLRKDGCSRQVGCSRQDVAPGKRARFEKADTLQTLL